ncbi:MAG: MarR family transcriptional regulator [Defluviitaleaceae bacterium]|nr:MarR family transcriptional regulator [Defluviitaleaceae bacterium]
MSKEKVLEALLGAEDMLDAKALVELTGLERADIDKAIKALKKEEKIESPKRCFYAAVK